MIHNYEMQIHELKVFGVMEDVMKKVVVVVKGQSDSVAQNHVESVGIVKPSQHLMFIIFSSTHNSLHPTFHLISYNKMQN